MFVSVVSLKLSWIASCPTYFVLADTERLYLAKRAVFSIVRMVLTRTSQWVQTNHLSESLAPVDVEGGRIVTRLLLNTDTVSSSMLRV